MNCALLDIACHIQGAAWEWWAQVSWLNKLLIVGGLVGIILGSSLGLLRILKMVGGWPAVIGAVAIVLGFVLAILPKRPKGEPIEHFPDGHEQTGGAFEFGVNKKKTKPKKAPRETVLRRPGETVGDWWERLAQQ